MKVNKIVLLVMLSIVIIFTSACSKANNQNAEEEKNEEGRKEKLTIGLTVGTLSNPFFVAMADGAKEAAKKYNAEVITESADYDLAKQTKQIEDFITKKVDLILLNAVDSRGIAAAVQQAKEAGIPIVAIDVEAEGGVDATVTSDNYQAGELAAKYVVERLNGKGKAVIIDGPPVSAIIDRVKGFENTINGSDIEVVAKQNGEASREKSQTVMENILQGNSEIDVVFGINDPTALGAMVASEQAGRDNEFFIVGVDGSPDAVEALKREDSAFAATPAQNPSGMAVKAIEIGMKILDGEKVEDIIKVPVELITKDNVHEYNGW